MEPSVGELLFMVITLVGLAFWVFMLGESAARKQWGWFTALVVTGVVGSIVYFLSRRITRSVAQ